MDERDIETLYSKVNKLTDRVTKIESTRPYLEEMISRNIDSQEKLANTMHEVQLTMVKMNEKMDDQSAALASMQKEMEENNKKTEIANKETNEKIERMKKDTVDKIKAVGKRVDTIEEKGKFDIHIFIKQNWGWIMSLIGVGVLYASQYVKF